MRHSAGTWSGKTSEVPIFSGDCRRIHPIFMRYLRRLSPTTNHWEHP